jgi:hypothetical protein
MARTEIKPEDFLDISKRFLYIVEKELCLSFNELSKVLGYSNSSPLTKVKSGEGFIGPDKMKRFALLKNNKGQHPNLNWVLTGTGNKMLGSESIHRDDAIRIGEALIARFGKDKALQLVELIKG